MTQKQVLLGAIAAVGLLGLTNAANAVVNFDTSLASPNANSASATQNSTSNSSFYNGNGNPQGGFTVAADNGIELGLRASLAFTGPEIDSPTSNYTVPTGVMANGHAFWNFDFSIDLQPGGFTPGGLTFASITPSLTITDLTTSATVTFNPNLIGDDEAYGDPANGNTMVVRHKGALATDWGSQNSESLSFGFLPGFSPWNGDTYQFTLTADGVSDSITVSAVPEPASMALLAGGLFGLGAVRRRRRQV